MKRLRKVLHVAMVWTTLSLLLVDPAAACRLMGRRCCRCCCEPASCDVATSAMPGQPSAFDAPPMAPIDAGQFPAGSLTAPSPSIGTVRLGEGLSPRVVHQGEASVTEATPTAPSPLGPATLQPTVTEPSPATSFAVPSIPRQPAHITPPRATPTIAPPTAAGKSANATRSATLDPHGPMPTTLQPRQAFDPAVVVPQPAATDAARHPTAEVTPAKPLTAAADAEPPMPTPKPAANSTKSPAAISAPPRSQPIQPPAFPPVADDPFALPTPDAAAPKSPSPADDDPFAPLPKPVAPPKQLTPPLTTEPTSKLADSFLPAADGRLPIREWSDNSGQFRVQARLALILDGKVRLLKESGRTTTVPTERLSATDRQYVAEIVARYGSDLSALGQLAAR